MNSKRPEGVRASVCMSPTVTGGRDAGALLGAMSNDDMMPFEADPEQMWTLTDDRQTVRLAVPPLPLEGLPEPLRITLDFNADAVDEILQRLTELRERMPSGPSTPRRTN